MMTPMAVLMGRAGMSRTNGRVQQKVQQTHGRRVTADGMMMQEDGMMMSRDEDQAGGPMMSRDNPTVKLQASLR